MVSIGLKKLRFTKITFSNLWIFRFGPMCHAKKVTTLWKVCFNHVYKRKEHKFRLLPSLYFDKSLLSQNKSGLTFGPSSSQPYHSGSLVRFGDFCISLLGNHVLACTSLWGCKVGNIFAKIYSFMTNGSDPLKIWVSFHLLTFAHLGWCLWCEGEGLSHCAKLHERGGREMANDSAIWMLSIPSDGKYTQAICWVNPSLTLDGSFADCSLKFSMGLHCIFVKGDLWDKESHNVISFYGEEEAKATVVQSSSCKLPLFPLPVLPLLLVQGI